MNLKQKKAANRLQAALVAAGKAGLMGGVFNGSFCLWPENKHLEHDPIFFERVEEVGIILYTPEVDLDGGAGV